eukprot:c19950_g1_i1 orf=248-559(+)
MATHRGPKPLSKMHDIPVFSTSKCLINLPSITSYQTPSPSSSHMCHLCLKTGSPPTEVTYNNYFTTFLELALLSSSAFHSGHESQPGIFLSQNYFAFYHSTSN